MSTNDVVQAVMKSESIHDFQARIYLYRDEIKIPLRFSRPHEAGTFTDGDWVQAGGRSDSPLVSIEYVSKTSDRIWVNIRGVAHNGNVHRLGISSSGYLGLYGYHNSLSPWKLELLDWTGQEMICYLRDHNGSRVGVNGTFTEVGGDRMVYLNCREGEPCKFLISRVGIPDKLEGISWLDE